MNVENQGVAVKTKGCKIKYKQQETLTIKHNLSAFVCIDTTENGEKAEKELPKKKELLMVFCRLL